MLDTQRNVCILFYYSRFYFARIAIKGDWKLEPSAQKWIIVNREFDWEVNTPPGDVSEQN